MVHECEHIVLGAGVAGLTSAHRLLGEANGIVLLDEYPEPGGNQRSVSLNGYTFDVGAFYYWRGMPFFQMFPEAEAACVSANIVVDRISPSGAIHRYPYSFKHEFLRRGPIYWTQAAASLLAARAEGQAFTSAEDYSIYYMGARLYRDLGMAAYMRRFYGVDPAQIDVQFAASRMAMVRNLASPRLAVSGLARRLQSRLRGDPARPNELLVRPSEGFSAMYGPCVTALRERGVTVKLGVNLRRVVKEPDGWLVVGDGFELRARTLVNTIPVARLGQLMGLPIAEGLESSDLLTLFVSFAGERGFHSNILYNFHATGRWKRATFHSDHYGARNGREYFCLEIPHYHEPIPAPEDAMEAFARSVQRLGLLRGDLKLEGSELLHHAYPAYVQGTSARLRRALGELEALGIRAVGRQGRFDYLPTGKAVVEQVDRHLTRAGD